MLECEVGNRKDHMTKISVIIPVYNAEKFLEQCITSVMNQTLKELEILCVNDGSTDASSEILKWLQMKDKRIKIFYQRNQGAGAARNLGIQYAVGTCLVFLDADDYYVDPDALEKMFDLCERKKVDICTSRYVETWNGGKHRKELFSKERVDHIVSYKEYQGDYFYQCYLFRRKFLIEYQIFFPPYRRYQDPPFFVKASYMAEIFTVADTCLYGYRIPNISARFNEEKARDLLKGIRDNLRFALKYNLNILFKNTLHRLEYEYADIIYHNISPDSLVMLELLVQINHIVGGKMGTQDYVIRPLRLILFHREAYEDFLIWKIKQKKKIAIYGAGKLGHAFLLFLEDKNLIDRVGHIVVSEYGGNESVIWGIPVISLKDFQKEHEDFIFVTVGEMYQEEIKGLLEQKEYKDYYIVREEFLHMLAENL